MEARTRAAVISSANAGEYKIAGTTWKILRRFEITHGRTAVFSSTQSGYEPLFRSSLKEINERLMHFKFCKYTTNLVSL